ncbi:stalk domain-containing protein [Paenibacillus gansuensis]|uniref:Stalk domain-containing protein n=1 Tax=Paenibacillus gansuensis TaxID=306542 RepID=A0ABW5PE16_9BACL
MKWKLLLMSCAAFGGIASASHAASNDIDVSINGKPVTFRAAPVSSGGSVFVEFVSVFKQLGYSSSYDPKTKMIKASNGQTKIFLQLGSKSAYINGVKKQLTSAPQAVKGFTFVPLRFIGEAAGKDVQWNASLNSVKIADKVDLSVEKPKLIKAYNDLMTAESKEDAAAFMALVDPSSPVYGLDQELQERLDQFDMLVKLDSLEITDIRSSEAVLHVVETTKKISGPFYLDNKTESLVLMRKIGDQWKFNTTQIVDREYLIPDGFFDKEASASPEALAAIKEAVQRNLDVTEKEDLDGVMKTISPDSPQYEFTKESTQELFSLYDVDYSLEKCTVLEVNEKTAYVYTMQTVKKVKGPEFQDYRAQIVHELHQDKDGAWLLYSSTFIKGDPLTS